MSPLLPPGLTALLEESRGLGFLGPGDVQRHVAHGSAMARVAPSVPRGFLDLGAGGGVPGLIEAFAWPDARGVLLEAQVRRADFLRDAVVRLGLEQRLEVVEGRAELEARDARWRESFDVVTARSFGPPAVTAECAIGFLAPGGHLVVSEPPEARGSTTARWPTEGLASLSLSAAVPVEVDGFSFVVMQRVSAVEGRWPRRIGVPNKRPLWGN